MDDFIDEKMKLSYRTGVCRKDVDSIGRLVEATGFFSVEEIGIARELVEERLQRGVDSGYYFLFAEEGLTLAGYACFGPIPGTMQSFDLYWIAVHPSFQKRGIGRTLLRAAEQEMVKNGAVRVYVDTSSRPQYEPTRQFYAACGYRKEAVLEDFYAPGDGKIIYMKILA
jgi:ribosomal protein S18 acetylase RimI-like enzyme